MLRALAAVLLMIPTLTYGAGPIDGIYFCTASWGSNTAPLYMTVNGQPDGRAIYAIAAVQEATFPYGYGVGLLYGNTFSGTNNFGLVFNTTVDGVSITGTIDMNAGAGPVPVNFSCGKIW
jgi:hypothetical protein